jgi:hypothetical protein
VCVIKPLRVTRKGIRWKKTNVKKLEIAF